ncbi:unnamed protein product [Peronospora belbahrii]|uniref:Actin-related protein 2/3 complex subunit 5 n=1 Tax=Peronospora belbahrii TaxID=622444 RepID=A0ABN8D7B3_9STRA|nr:unnamed protein product [Peronospora belbahrii]
MAVDEAQISASVQARATKVQGLLAKRKHEEAVLVSLEDPPLQSKNNTVKDENAKSAVILEWHQKLVAKAGSGCVMRAFTERKQV